MKFIDERIEKYALDHSSHPSHLCADLEQYTRDNEPMSMMLIGKLEASFLRTLIKLSGAKRVVEFGTYTGYSALAMAEALPQDGEIHTIDIEQKPYTANYWNKSEHSSKINFHLGKGLEKIDEIEGEIDLVFIDADKVNYINYFEKVLPRLSERGMIVFDNVLWSGKVLDDNPEEESTKALKELNTFLANHDGLTTTMLPIRDGLMLVMKN
ncbi:MAG: methyltransferase [Oligoflexia bacterium]|nr:methyltransferase [Oligoflexia bacterium]